MAMTLQVAAFAKGISRYSPVTDFREARCRAFHETRCARGGACNFMHIKHIPKALVGPRCRRWQVSPWSLVVNSHVSIGPHSWLVFVQTIIMRLFGWAIVFCHRHCIYWLVVAVIRSYRTTWICTADATYQLGRRRIMYRWVSLAWVCQSHCCCSDPSLNCAKLPEAYLPRIWYIFLMQLPKHFFDTHILGTNCG